MMEFWQQLIISWGGNAILGGLVIYLGKIYLERIGRNEQASIDERLKSLEQDHEKMLAKEEHFHQISQQTYQKIFDRKISVYDELLSLTMSFEKITHPNFSSVDQATTESRVGYGLLLTGVFTELSKFYSAIDKLISKNITVISSELYEEHLTWLIHFRAEFDSYNKERLDNHLNEIGKAVVSQLSSDSEQIKEMLDKIQEDSNKETELHIIKGNLLSVNLQYFSKVLEQIKKDSVKLNKRINDIYL